MPEYTFGQVAKMWVGSQLRSWLSNWPASEFPRVFGYGSGTSSGVPVNEDTALNYSAWFSAVSIISADVASLPLILYKRTSNGGKERYLDSKLYELLHDAPNPEMTSMVFREGLQAHALTWGNAYAEIERDQLGRPKYLWPLTPDRVTPLRERGYDGRYGPLKYRVTNSGGGQTFLSQRDMLHVPGLGFDGTTGYSVVSMASESIGLGLATERFGGEFFGNGTTFGGVLSTEKPLTTEVKQGIRESIDAIHTGVDRAHRFAIFGHGMKFEKTGIPPNDAQFLETRKFQITEIARWFQIPPHKLGDLERATFSNIEQQDIEYYRSCLRRWLVRWEQELTRKLISPMERKQQFIKHNVEGFLRGDSAARSTFYREMFNIGAYSINMILDSEDQNRIGSEGDVHFVQGNLLPAKLAMEGPPEQKPLPTVTDVTPKKGLPPANDEDEEGDDEQKALRALLSEIAGNTAALQASMAAERDAMSQAELERHRAEVTRLEEERAALQQQLEEHRTQHAAELQTTRKDTDAERSAREAAEAALLTATAAREAADEAARAERADREAAEQRAAEEAAARVATETRIAGELTEHRATADEAVMVARRALDEAEAARLAAVAEAEAAKAAAAALEEQSKAAAAALLDRREAETARLTGVLTAHRALIVDALGRMVRREAEKARRHQATAEKLRTWAASFYLTDADIWVDALKPAIRVHLAWKQSADDVDAYTLALVQAHLAESQRQLKAIIDGDPEDMHGNLERMLTRWEQERPNAMADQILKEEVEYVRAYR